MYNQYKKQLHQGGGLIMRVLFTIAALTLIFIYFGFDLRGFIDNGGLQAIWGRIFGN